MAEKSGADVAAPESATQEEGSPLGLDGFAARWMPGEESEQDSPEDPETDAPEGEEQPEAEAQEPEAGDEPAAEEEEDSILARLGIDSASDDDLRELSKELGGRLGPRIGELTEKARRAEEENKALRAELKKREPFESKVRDNPYRDKADTLEKASELLEAAVETVRDAEIALEDNEDLASDDEMEFGGHVLPKKKVREILRNARDARDRYLPDRIRELEKLTDFESARERNLGVVHKIHPWHAEEDNPLRKAYDHWAPRIESLFRESDPELLPRIPLILSDHLQAEQERAGQPNGKPKPAAAKPASAPKRPPSNPGGSGGGSSRPEAQSRKKKEAKFAAFEQGGDGSVNAFAKLFMPD